MLGRVIATFKTLCDLGIFPTGLEDSTPAPQKGQPAHTTQPMLNVANLGGKQLVINLNIQLQLAATDNADIYDKIFQSLKKNVNDK